MIQGVDIKKLVRLQRTATKNKRKVRLYNTVQNIKIELICLCIRTEQQQQNNNNRTTTEQQNNNRTPPPEQTENDYMQEGHTKIHLPIEKHRRWIRINKQ